MGQFSFHYCITAPRTPIVGYLWSVTFVSICYGALFAASGAFEGTFDWERGSRRPTNIAIKTMWLFVVIWLVVAVSAIIPFVIAWSSADTFSIRNILYYLVAGALAPFTSLLILWPQAVMGWLFFAPAGLIGGGVFWWFSGRHFGR